ncbi:hypothetical protein POSPLADRAFT_1143568 [Postia placenta MAD-698-R-SB12]|uniref:Aminopeptidase n=1 Tax=Postia placenta MAD-698-R-SB12 TaxID=670580 RepID=A0A1X6N076_9APHY|nr:hypothetical protein POSPLADRAFT_1143568 [Postia placenta MAD-698-R-SB12]OSX62014.1 hypothetical protein POSPLADRAFT_1143568 [Postia placenta MAD-698-R-SB12]
MNPSETGHHRLPTSVEPTHYDLTVCTDLVYAKFDGIVKIDLYVRDKTSDIVFNTKDMQLGSVTVYSDALRTEQHPKSMSFDTDRERGTLSLPTSLPAGSKAQVSISFEGPLTGALMGYYRSVGGADGKEVYSLTQFEPTAARRAFPCWDEPALKATFAVTMISRADTVNLSNMSVESESTYEPGSLDATGAVVWLTKLASPAISGTAAGDKWKITRFQTTPPMSTYLVAYANGRFEHVETTYTTNFALDVKRRVLPIYEKVFNIEYPLPKLDTLVASDYNSGQIGQATECSGLITGRVTAFCLDPRSENLQVKKQIAVTMCHEVAHMWFGDITTMEWWDNLYLNEGRVLLLRIFPEWKMNASFISDSLFRAFSLDAKLSSHPVEVECPDDNMVHGIFDALSYSKAASVLRMLSAYVGEERFLKGVSIYLKRHLFANSTTKDLWDGISDATGLDVSKMMDCWIKQVGFPVVTVTETTNGIHIRQDRFLETGPADELDSQTTWSIPLRLLTVSDKGEVIVDKEILLEQREMIIPLDISKPFKLNAGTVGFYRVLYSTERLITIGAEAAKAASPFSVEDRTGLVYDALALAKAGFLTVSSALSLFEVLREEREYSVLQGILSNLESIRSTWWEHPDISLVSPIVQQLGWDNRKSDSDDDRALRILAIQHAASAEDTSVIRELKARFSRFMETGDDSIIPPDLVGVIYMNAVRCGGRKEWEAVKRIVQKPKNPAYGTSAMIAMGHTSHLELAEETFQCILNESRDQDLIFYLDGLSTNRKTRRFLATAFMRHYDEFAKRLEGNFSMRYLIFRVFQSLSSRRDHQEIANFFKEKDTSKYNMALKQTLDNIAAQAAWVERSTDDLLRWA